MRPPITTLFAVLLAVISFEAASECSNKTIELIRSSSKASTGVPGSAGGGIKDKAIAFVQFALRNDPEIRDHNIALIRACTDSDLASIAPNTKTSQSGSAASNCPAKIVVVDTARDYYGMHDLNSYEIVSTNPISIRANSGTRFLNSLPGSPAGDQWGEGTLLTDINSVLTKQREVLDSDQRRISSCSQGCCDSAASLCSMKRDNQAKMVEWLQCVAKGSPMSSGSAVPVSTGAASTQSGLKVGNASEVSGQRPNRKNAFNPNSPQGASAQQQTGPSNGECKNGDPSCAIRSCNRSGGKAITHRNNLGCGVVSCRFADTKYDWSSVYNFVPGSGCAGSTK